MSLCADCVVKYGHTKVVMEETPVLNIRYRPCEDCMNTTTVIKVDPYWECAKSSNGRIESQL